MINELWYQTYINCKQLFFSYIFTSQICDFFLEENKNVLRILMFLFLFLEFFPPIFRIASQ